MTEKSSIRAPMCVDHLTECECLSASANNSGRGHDYYAGRRIEDLGGFEPGGEAPIVGAGHDDGRGYGQGCTGSHLTVDFNIHEARGRGAGEAEGNWLNEPEGK